jgi:hypothetical protein
MNSEEEDNERTDSPLAHLFATIERDVASLRSGEISGRDVRALARERRRKEQAFWGPIRTPSRPRGAR